jgi:putative DNA primase/helicase
VSLLQSALDYYTSGISVVPTATDGTKRPAGKWKTYTTTRASEEQLHAWFDSDTYDGLGLICGAVSEHLEMLEVEGRALELVGQLAQLMNDNGLGELWVRLSTGYLERSPSGGLHWLYKVTDGPARPNTKLARRPSTETELADHKQREAAKATETLTGDKLADRLARIHGLTHTQVPQVLIETRGEGGFTVAAPSNGRTHPTGAAWVRVAGAPGTIPGITSVERDALYAIANMLDTMPVPEISASVSNTAPKDEQQTDPFDLDPTHSSGTSETGVRPGDDYNARTTWDDILTPLGWAKTRTFGRDRQGWTRPGKGAREGISATTGGAADGVDRLYVFSSSTEFETEKPYDKFAAYTMLEHRGDFAAAASALSKNGYGSKPPIVEPARPAAAMTPTPTPAEQVAAGGSQNPPADIPPAEVGPGPATYTFTDDGNALRLVDEYADQIRYCPERAQWLRWDSAKWTWDTSNTIQELARQIARGLPTDSKDDRKHRQVSLSARGVGAMTRLASSDARTVIHVGALDARPYEVNTPGGIIDLRTGHLRAPDPTAHHTRSTTVTPQPGPAPRWERFLADTFAGDPALTAYVQRLIGVSLIGTVLEQLLPFPFGSGANGKTTLLGVFQRLIGIGDGGYSISAPADMLLATQNAGHPTEIARLSGARLVVTSELEDGQRFAEAKVKQLTGSDVISGRFMRQDWFSFKPTHTLWLLANHQPEVRAGGPAFWRRIALLPFLHTVPAEQRDPHLEDRLVEEEGPQILSWMLAGAVAYLEHGLSRPDSVEVATEAYAKDQDTVARFVEECCDLAAPGTPSYDVTSAKLRAAYETWCRQEGETPIPAKTLTLQLRRFDVQSVRTMHARMLAGIRLKVQIEDDTHASYEPPADDTGPTAHNLLPGSGS